MQHLKSFVVVAMTCFALAACGGGSGDDDIAPTPDAGIHIGPDATPQVTTCNTVDQDCTGTNQKCTVAIGTDNSWSTVCRDIHENPIGVDQPCMRDSDGNTGVGRDNCDKGGYCTALGNPDGTFGAGHQTCRAFCRATSQCAEGHECMTLTDLTPTDGICIDSCTPLGNDTCIDNAWCEPKDNIQGSTRGICIKGGNIAPGGMWGGAITDDCAAGTICVTHNDTMMSTCDTVCDFAATQVTCPQDPVATTCTMIGGFATDYGVCLASAARGGVKYHRPVQSLLPQQ